MLLKPRQRLSALQLAAMMDTSPAAASPSGLALAMSFWSASMFQKAAKPSTCGQEPGASNWK